MFSLIIKSYLTLFLSISVFSIILFFVGIFWIYKIFIKSSASEKKELSTIQDLSTIAGDDILATQLDLARAYMETGKEILAKKILQQVIKQGSPFQKNEAHQLLSSISQTT